MEERGTYAIGSRSQHNVQVKEDTIMKRSVDLLLVLVLLAGVLAGCAPAAAPTAQIVKETVEVPVTVQVPVKETVVVTAVPAASEPAATSSEASYEVVSPLGKPSVEMISMAPRPTTLDGMTVCYITDELFRADYTFPIVTEMLQEKYPTVKVVPETEMPHGSVDAYGPSLKAKTEQDITAALKEKGCQAVVAGNGG